MTSRSLLIECLQKGDTTKKDQNKRLLHERKEF